jgi:AraC-like DNA-binding protein
VGAERQLAESGADFEGKVSTVDFLSAAVPAPERATAYQQTLERYFAYLTPDARTVQRLFATSSTTFQDWLRERRLERCWQELTCGGPRRSTIADVAFSCGFSDLSTFNRAFQACFGVTPRAAQVAACDGAALTPGISATA